MLDTILSLKIFIPVVVVFLSIDHILVEISIIANRRREIHIWSMGIVVGFFSLQEIGPESIWMCIKAARQMK